MKGTSPSCSNHSPTALCNTEGAKGRKERNERTGALDLEVQDVFHVGAARVADDAAIAQRARAPLHAALEPADHLATGDGGGSSLPLPPAGEGWGEGGCGFTASPLFKQAADLRVGEVGAPVSVVHEEGAGGGTLTPTLSRRRERE